MQSLPDVPVKHIVIATLAVSVLIVFVLLVGFFITHDTGTADSVSHQPPRSALEQIIGPLQPFHYIYPNPDDEFLQLQLYPFREPGSPWSEQEIGPFWLDPLTIGLEDVENSNRELVRELYQTIP